MPEPETDDERAALETPYAEDRDYMRPFARDDPDSALGVVPSYPVNALPAAAQELVRCAGSPGCQRLSWLVQRSPPSRPRSDRQ
jgi:hypothetical protein